MSELPRLGRVVWYELMTTDLKAAEAFYSRVVGWTMKPFDQSPQPYDLLVKPDGNAMGGAMTLPEGLNAPPHWMLYVAAPQLEDAVAEVERHGGKVLSPVVEVPTVGRIRVVLDPQGAAFALFESVMPMTAPEGVYTTGDVSWHELFTTNADAALAFYTTLFGWRPVPPFDMGAMGKYYMFARVKDLGGMMNKPPAMAHVPSHWGLYFFVPDVDAGARLVTELGGTVLNGPMDVPNGAGRVVNCMDPQGAAFSLHQTGRAGA